MFSPDAADRTLPPTERRRREARSRGEVVHSPELTSAIALLAASSAFWWFAPAWSAELVSLIRRALTTTPTFTPTIPTIAVLTRKTSEVLVAVLVPLAIFVVLCAGFANLVQTGWVWNPASIVPRFRWRAWISRERAAETAGLMLRLILLVSVAWLFARSHYSQFFSLGQGEPAFLLARSARLVGELSIQLSTCLVALGLVDYAFRFWHHEQRLKMTIEERRREQQEDEIDPGIKQRRAVSRRRTSSASPFVESIGNLRG